MEQNTLISVCKELFAETPLEYFSYSITDINAGEYNYISVNPKLNQTQFNENFPLLSLYLHPGYYWSKAFMPPHTMDIYRSINIDNAFYVIKSNDNYVEVFTFGTTNEHPDIVNFYFNNLSVLEMFILHFKEKGKDIIQDLIKNMHPIDEKLKTLYYETFLKECMDRHPVVAEKFYNAQTKDWISLSPRERDILVKSAIDGLTAAQIGEALNLSPKTIESHLDNLRVKLSAKTAKGLLKQAVQMGLVKIHTYF